MVYAIIIAIVVLAVILVGIGIYFVLDRAQTEEKPTSIIQMSGQYAVALRPVRDSLEEAKPSRAAVQEWLAHQLIPDAQKEALLSAWDGALEQTIRTVDEGDREGITSYRIVVGQKDAERLRFLPPQNNYITREQVRNHSELLPPYYPGSDSQIAPKHPWENAGKSGWKAILPDGGKYNIPDWRQIG
jgi:hypothetical protein